MSSLDIIMSTTFISAITGAAVASCINIWWNHKKEKILIKNSLEALNKEANMLIEISSDIFKAIKDNNPNETCSYFTHISQNYFSIYENNVAMIGEISDDDYRGTIIRFYFLAKRLVDALISNNNYLERKILNKDQFEIIGKPYFDKSAKTMSLLMVQETKHLKEITGKIEKQLKLYNELHPKYLAEFSTCSEKIKSWCKKQVSFK